MERLVDNLQIYSNLVQMLQQSSIFKFEFRKDRPIKIKLVRIFEVKSLVS